MNYDNVRSETPGPWIRMLQWLMPRITPGHVRLYRLLGGRFVNQATGGAPVLLLTTRGQHSSLARTVALGNLRDGNDLLVAGTNGGLPALPAWVLNLQAHPHAEVQIDREEYAVSAERLAGKEWPCVWQRLVTDFPVYEQAQRFAGRTVPLIRLRKADCGEFSPQTATGIYSGKED